MCITKADIVIVDDNSINLTILATILKADGFLVRPALNGKDALAIIQQKKPDLILLDIIMPYLSGYDVCQALKEKESTRDIPIIIISKIDATEDKVRSFSLGAVDYITKPFHDDEVLMRVTLHLNLLRLRQNLEEKNTRLQAALKENKVLKDILPICSSCKQIRDDEGYWNQFEEYVTEHSNTQFSHSICPVCMEKLYSGDEWYQSMQKEKTL